MALYNRKYEEKKNAQTYLNSIFVRCTKYSYDRGCCSMWSLLEGLKSSDSVCLTADHNCSTEIFCSANVSMRSHYVVFVSFLGFLCATATSPSIGVFWNYFFPHNPFFPWLEQYRMCAEFKAFPQVSSIYRDIGVEEFYFITNRFIANVVGNRFVVE